LLLLALFCGFFENGCRAEPWPLWEQYAQRYVDVQGRVIDRQSQDRTTSEGQAYAMFFALVAGDRPRFEKLLQWTEDNMAGGDMTARLPAWNWGKAPDGSWRVIDANSASDADLWMSYTLLQAGRLWNDQRYQKLGSVMAARIAHNEVVLVPTVGPVLIPGPSGFHPDANTWVLNPSYMPLPLIAQMAKAEPDGPWAEMIRSLPRLLAASTAGGFAMDWVQYNTVSGWKPVPLPGQPAGTPALGSYDAIRVYLWAGMSDHSTPGQQECMDAISGMAAYLKTQLLPPAKVDDHGQVAAADGTVGFSAALIPYLDAAGEKKQSKDQMERVLATKDASTGLFGHNQDYYDQNLALFGLGWSEQRFRFEKDGRLKVKWK
jgi:endoglucanase